MRKAPTRSLQVYKATIRDRVRYALGTTRRKMILFPVPGFKDCLLIKELGAGKIAVEIYSTQADQHVCAVSGNGTIEKGIPNYRFGAGVGSQRLEFIAEKDGVALRHIVADGEEPVNCGPHASFDGLKFKKSDSNVGKHVCFRD